MLHKTGQEMLVFSPVVQAGPFFKPSQRELGPEKVLAELFETAKGGYNRVARHGFFSYSLKWASLQPHFSLERKPGELKQKRNQLFLG
jgi:hypothetical protein